MSSLQHVGLMYVLLWLLYAAQVASYLGHKGTCRHEAQLSEGNRACHSDHSTRITGSTHTHMTSVSRIVDAI